MQAAPPQLSPEAVFAVIAMAGFAVQRVVELVDPIVELAIFKSREKVSALDPWEQTIKKLVLMVIALCAAGFIVQVTGIRLLALLPDIGADVTGDYFVTVLVLSAGTEAANSLTKWLQYVKDARNPARVALTITPASAEIVDGESASFVASVRNSPNKLVQWRLLHGPGSIDSRGLFSSAGSGKARIAAISEADPEAIATASVDVKAKVRP